VRRDIVAQNGLGGKSQGSKEQESKGAGEQARVEQGSGGQSSSGALRLDEPQAGSVVWLLAGQSHLDSHYLRECHSERGEGISPCACGGSSLDALALNDECGCPEALSLTLARARDLW
jgi:hypothetical protein